MDKEFGGLNSEWNEGQFKSMRIHDSQNLINFYKRNLIARSEGRFNYEHWFTECINLRDEGNSKYSDEEIKGVDRLELIIKDLLKYKPGHIPIKEGKMGTSTTKYIFNKENFEKICDYIRSYEQLVKQLNDEHGLTTKNKSFDDDGL